MRVYFVQGSDDVLRILSLPSIDDDRIRKEMRDICLINASSDAYEKGRIETCNGNLVIFMKFLNV